MGKTPLMKARSTIKDMPSEKSLHNKLHALFTFYKHQSLSALLLKLLKVIIFESNNLLPKICQACRVFLMCSCIYRGFLPASHSLIATIPSAITEGQSRIIRDHKMSQNNKETHSQSIQKEKKSNKCCS